MNVLLFLSLFIFNRIVEAATCIQHSDPLNPSKYTVSNCTSGHPSHSAHSQRHRRDELAFNGTNMFHISFSCYGTDAPSCSRAKSTFIKAGEIISSVIRFQKPVTVNATFLPFCSMLDICPNDGRKVIGNVEVSQNFSIAKNDRPIIADDCLNIGSAYPAVSHLMTDQSDNMTRMYPQALLKQFRHLGEVPNWASFDINAKFDSDIDWYFEGTGNIANQQQDFLRIVVHEYIHGLGFLNSWNNYLWNTFQQVDPNCTQFLTPMPISPPNQLQSVYDQAQDADGPQPFWGFVEYPLDKLVKVNATNTWLSESTTQLNGWGNSNVMFASLPDMYHSWQISDYSNTAYQIYNLSIQPRSLTVSNKNFGDIWLETSLNPFVVGSSLSHFDNMAYDSTIDYLMVYQADPGLNIQQYVTSRGGGPLGPKLLLVLQKLGYDLVNATNSTQPKLVPWQQPKNMVGTTDNPSPSVSYVAALVSATSSSTPTQTTTTTVSQAVTGISTNSFSLLVTMLAIVSLL